MRHFSVGNIVPVGVYSLNCTGVEQNWTDCNYSLRSPTDSCDSTASISCQGDFYDSQQCRVLVVTNKLSICCTTCVAPTTLPSNCTNGDVRLSGGSSSSEGYVQVCINNAWGSVCGSNWDSQDGNVVCGQLGLLPRGNAIISDAASSIG